MNAHTSTPAPITSDAQLSRRLRARDHAAWEELYAAHGPQLRAFALRLTRSPHEADDLVQETFVRVLPRLDRLDPERVALRPYLFTTLRNTFLKSCERRRRVAPVQEVPEPDAPAAIEDDPERSLLLQGQIEQVRAATLSLAPRQRLALALRELEDCSYAEIGAIVGLKENAVAQLISRARESLRSALRLAQVDGADMPDACRRLLPQLSRHLDGQLRGEPLQRTLAHLEGCGTCQEALASMREASQRYRAFAPPLVIAHEAHAAAIDAELTATGYWQSRPSRWSQRASRRVALVTGTALLLGGGAIATLASQTAPADRAAGLAAPDVAAAITSPGRSAPAVTAAAATAGPPNAAPAQPATSSIDVPAAGTARSGERAQSVRPRARSPRSRARPRAPQRNRRERAPDRFAPGSAPTAGSSTGPGSGGATQSPAAAPEPVADRTPPATDITSVSTSEDDAQFTFAASEGAATFACALDAGSFEPCTSPKAYTDLPPGDHTFRVRATDVAGNTGAADTHLWKVSKPQPDLVVTALTETGFTVANVGSVPAGMFVVSVTLVGSYTFAGLPAGAKATRTWPCRRGTLSAIADRGNTVDESDETNNRRSFDSLC